MGIEFSPIQVQKEYLLGTFDEQSGMRPEDLPAVMRVAIYDSMASTRDVFMGRSWSVVGSAQLRLDGNLLYATPSFFIRQEDRSVRLIAVSAASHEGDNLVKNKLLGLKISPA